MPNIPATFLRGPDLSYLHHLRRLTVKSITLTSIFDFLLSATALTDLTLVIDTPFGPTPETSHLACLQVMPCLLSLDLTLLARLIHIDWDTPSESFTPEDGRIVRAFTRWLRAPSLECLKFQSPGPDFSLLL